MTVITLPKDLSAFMSKTKHKTPYDLFYEYVLREMFPMWETLYDDNEQIRLPNGKRFHCQYVVVTDKTDKELMEICIKWAQKYKHLRKEQARSAVSWLHLDIGPSIRELDGIIKEDNKVYIMDEAIS